MNSERILLKAITEGIKDKKGKGIVVADLTSIITAPCSYLVICQGNSPQQVEAITESIAERARIDAGEKPSAVAGQENAEWIAMDYGNVMTHVFLPETRSFYDLESLWKDAKLTEIADED